MLLYLFMVFLALFQIFALNIKQMPEEKNISESIELIKDSQKEQYLNQNFHSDTFNYGYNVKFHNQFHHQVKDLRGITYGCYGYINAHGNHTVIFYISDEWGYRVIHPKGEVNVFYSNVPSSNYDQHNEQSINPQQGILTSWENLHFPSNYFSPYPRKLHKDREIIVQTEKPSTTEILRGPYPTGSPGPNGPWPGDPEYRKI
ncbi:uncharacterized protein LOC127288929 isoform X2 [Leptopilina boulardi]|uniref:uncharacterized protein LOC127288929 isoform X2 n=1 Tax=Leptopilina boulardi TaxID=63433 RepID=UPI0021F67063|nr:uncharacterized protein LOC127288929 isoform X2 [Leptopilina boulardi]